MSTLLPPLWPALFSPLASVEDVQFDQIGPTPPTPSGPLNVVVPANNGLVAFSQSYTTANSILVVRVAFLNNGTGAPTMAATYGGVSMVLDAYQSGTAAGQPGVAHFHLTGITPGAATLAITCSAGSAGRALVRIGELSALTGIGVTDTTVQGNDQGYYAECDAIATAPGASLMSTIACFNRVTAYPIDTSYTDTEQWNYGANGIAGRFAYGTSPSGEPGVPGLFVWYAYRSDPTTYSAACVVELLGGVVAT